MKKKKKKEITTSQCHPCLLSNDPKLSRSDPSVVFLPSHAVMSVTVLCPPVTLNSKASLTGTDHTAEEGKK